MGSACDRRAWASGEVYVKGVDFLGAGVTNRHDRIVGGGGHLWAELRVVRLEALQVEKKFSMSIAKLDASHIGSGCKAGVLQITAVRGPRWIRDDSLVSDPLRPLLRMHVEKKKLL